MLLRIPAAMDDALGISNVKDTEQQFPRVLKKLAEHSLTVVVLKR